MSMWDTTSGGKNNTVSRKNNQTIFKRIMKLRSITTLLFCLIFTLGAYAYPSKKDMERIEQLLEQAQNLPKDSNLMLHFGKQFLGIPYVAHTLDRDSVEKLVINTRELDCTTFVENVVALTLCAQRGERRFHDYELQLQKIRYRNGKVEYTRRLHYFTYWIEDNVRMGYVKKVESDYMPFTAVQKLNVFYMSKYWESYSMLASHPQWISGIKEMENILTGNSFRYIPKSNISNSQILRQTIKDGDIIAILTKKKGLDTSHIGIAVWKKDGLHLMNASSIHKKVVIEPMLLQNYMKKHPSQIGIRVCRVVDLKKN